MAKNPNRSYNVKVAATAKKNKFDLSKRHICTSDFGVLKSIDCRLYIPGDDFSFKVSQFTRLMPMPVPTYGNIKSITRCFVVPINTVMTNFDEFLSGNLSSTGAGFSNLSNPVVPYISTANLVSCFLDVNLNLVESVTPIVDGTPLTGFDTIIRDGQTSFKGVRYSWLGRKIVAWLNGLGLNWRWSTYESDRTNISVLPLLCWWKFYLDWIVPARFVNDFAYQRSTLGIAYTSANGNFFTVVCNNLPENLIKFLIPVSCYYSDDYFTNAFAKSYGSELERVNSDFGIYNISGQLVDSDSSGFDYAGIGDDDVPSILNSGGSSSDNAKINYFTLQSLGALQVLINRGKLAGSKIQDYLLTTYGLRPSDDVLHLSKYIGCHRNTIQIGDIKATATTDATVGGQIKTTYLGQFAGQAIGGNVDTFKFGGFEEHSYIFITNELSLDPSYTQGLHHEFTALNRYQFYDPTFDGFGVTQIPFRELGADVDFSTFLNGKLNWLPAQDKPFGYQPVYGEFKTSFDIVSGDFRCGSLNTGLDSWYLNRKIDADYIENNGDYINRKFCEQVSDSNSYDRIFQIANNDSDHFYSVFDIECTAYRHMVSLTDALETESQDNEPHKVVNVDFQGTVNS